MENGLPGNPNPLTVKNAVFTDSKIKGLEGRIDSLTKVASDASKPKTTYNFNDMLNRMSNKQLLDTLGTDDSREVDALRLNPDAYFSTNTFGKYRVEALAQHISDGKVEGGMDADSNTFLDSFGAIFGAGKKGVEFAFKALELYDRNVADPVAGGASWLISQLISGEQDIEKAIREKVEAGENYWSAMGNSFEEWGAPGWAKFGIQLAADPLILAGGINLLRKGIYTGRAFAELADPGIGLSIKAGRGLGRKIAGTGKLGNARPAILPLPSMENITTGMGASAGLTRTAAKFLEIFDPSQVYSIDTMEGALIAREKLIASGAQLTELDNSYLQSIGSFNDVFNIEPSKEFLLQHAKIRTTDGKYTDIFELWNSPRGSNVHNLTDTQFEWLEEARTLVKAAEDYHLKNGLRKAGDGVNDFKHLTVPQHAVDSIKNDIFLGKTTLPQKADNTLVNAGRSRSSSHFSQRSPRTASNNLTYLAQTGYFGARWAKPGESFEKIIGNYIQDVYADVADRTFLNIPVVKKSLTRKSRIDTANEVPGQEFDFIEAVGEKDLDEFGNLKIKKGYKVDNFTVADELGELTSIEFVDKELADLVQKQMGKNTSKSPLEHLGDASDFLRLMRSSTDFGAPMIQGLGVLFRNPKVWAKATKMHFEAFGKSPAFRAKYIQDNVDDVFEFMDNGGILGSSEFFDSLKNNGWMARLPNQGAIEAVFGRFGRSFDVFLDVAKVEYFKSLKKTAINSGGEMRDLASHVNKLLGTIDTASMGVNSGQRTFERAIVMFSPRYTRAIASILIDATRGGLKGTEARSAISHLLVGGAVTHRAFAEILGQEANLDPTDPNFMKVKIGGVMVGPGGKFKSFLRTAAKIATTEDAGDFLQINPASPDSYQRNPLMQFIRSNSAPASGSLMNLLLNENGIGEALPDEDPVGTASYAFQELLPFFAQAGFSSGSWKQKVGAGTSEFFGATANTPREIDILRNMQNKYAQEDFNKDWEELGKDIQFQVSKNHPEIKEQQINTNEESLRSSRYADQTKFYQNNSEYEVEWSDDVNLAAAEFISGKNGSTKGKNFRDKLREADKRRYDKMEQNKKFYPSVVEGWAKSDEKNQGKEDSPLFNTAKDEYLSKVFSSINEAGDMDYALSDLRKEELRLTWGNEMVDRIETYLSEKRLDRGDVPVADAVQDYYQAIGLLRPYWNLWETELTGQEKVFWQNLIVNQDGSSRTKAEVEASLAENSGRGSVLRSLDRRLRLAKIRFRRTNEDIDLALMRFWDMVPRNPKNISDRKMHLTGIR